MLQIRNGKNTFNRNVFKRNWKTNNKNPLARACAIVRNNAKQSIRRRGKKGKPSSPGKPPRYDDEIFRAIFYDVDENKTEGMVGPYASSSSKRGDGHTVPEIHEKGLNVTVAIRITKRHGKVIKNPVIVNKSASYPQRAFMLPALIKTKTKLPELWRDAIK